MARMHVNLGVTDLPASIDFYTRLFGAPPTVRKPDYAKWLLEEPRVNFAIGARSGRPGIEHLGIQADSPEELDRLRARWAGAESSVDHEGETICCYSRSDKSWVADGQGVSWEMFYTHGSAETYDGGAEAEACCGPGCCETEAVTSSAPEPASAECCGT